MPSPPTCLTCRYELTGLTPAPGSPLSQCPECGRAFDPGDPMTFGPRQKSLRTVMFIASIAPPRWLCWVYSVPVAAVFLCRCSPTGDVADGWIGFPLFIIGTTVFVWGIAAVIHLVGRAVLFFKNQKQPRWRVRWLVIPLVLVGSVLIQQSGIIFHLRWRAARSEFEAIRTLPQPPSTSRWIGTFRVEKIQVRTGPSYIAARQTRGDVFVFWLGISDPYSDKTPVIIHAPEGDPGGWPITTPLGNGWWAGVDPT